MTGGVVVVGGGPEGLRAAVAQAEKGCQVCLIESGPSLLAEPDDIARVGELKDRIRVITLAGLDDVKRKDGQFHIRLTKRASRVIDERCNGCDDCARVCPASMGDATRARLSQRTAIDSATPGGSGYNIVRETPPCQDACPVHLDVRGYVGLAADGRYAESLDLIRQRLPFPGIIGRICTRPCEGVCNRGLADEPVEICALKRFVADYERKESKGAGKTAALVSGPSTGKRVAVVGAGPAGLTCAYELVRKGRQATVFESLPVVGGMLRVGIPEYRLPRDILDEEVELVRRSGVEFRTGVTLGRDITVEGLLRDGFDAVFVAIGAHKGQVLGIPGEGVAEVTNGVDFLRELNLGRKPEVGRKTVIVGGGNVAIDCARSAKRLGAASVTVVYRRSRQEMTAYPAEVDAAIAEGVDIIMLAAPVEVMAGDGKAKGLRCRRMELGKPDKTGRRAPVPVPGSEFELEADTVIAAVGQSVDETVAGAAGLSLVGGHLAVDDVTLASSVQGVFAGGDAATGPRSAIEAIAAGRRAAESIDSYLKGSTMGRVIEGELPCHSERSEESIPRSAKPDSTLAPGSLRDTSRLAPKDWAVEARTTCHSERSEESARRSAKPDSTLAQGLLRDTSRLVPKDLVVEARTTCHSERSEESAPRSAKPDSTLAQGLLRDTSRMAPKPFLDIPSPSATMPEIPVSVRIASFAEVESGLPEQLARSEAKRCLSCRGCLGCGLCEAVCRKKAVAFDMHDEGVEIEADQVILTPGVNKRSPRLDGRYGYGTSPDILTMAEFESMLLENGPFGGMVLRPSNGDVPQRIASVVAVAEGQENLGPAMVDSVRELAERAKARLPDSRIVVLCQGQALPSDDNPVDATGGVSFVAADGVSVGSGPKGGLMVSCSGNVAGDDRFDLVVLCTGVQLSAVTAEWSRKLGLALEGQVLYPDASGSWHKSDADGVLLSGMRSATC